MSELGFRETGDEAYACWLGKRHGSEIWGQVFSNAMAMAIRMVVEGWGREQESERGERGRARQSTAERGRVQQSAAE